MTMTARTGRVGAWVRPFYVDGRFLAHALCNGLWRALSPGRRRLGAEQQVLAWAIPLPGLADASAVVAYLRHAGLRVYEGGNAFYIPPQPGLADMLGAVVRRYPPRSGFKVLRDFRGLDEAHYLHPTRQTRLRRRLIGAPREQVVVANYLHRLGLGPRVWDVCVFRAGRLTMPAFVVQHVEGEPPAAADWAGFMARLRAALADTELRVNVPDWERRKDFGCPTCNGNLVRDAGGATYYVDFQNFSIRNPARLLPKALAVASGPVHCGERWPRTPADDRFRTIRGMLRAHGVEFRERLVVDVGSDASVMLRQALSTGAWWSLGWDRPALAEAARTMAVARGFTRLEMIAARPGEPMDLGASIPPWLHPYLAEAVVFYRGTSPALPSPVALRDLPWRALVYEGQPGESLPVAEGAVRPLVRPGVVSGMIPPSAVSPAPPVIVLVRRAGDAPYGGPGNADRNEGGDGDG